MPKRIKVIPDFVITFVIDKSGSMAGLENDVIGGFNNFIVEQINAPGVAYFNTLQFDDRMEWMAPRFVEISKFDKLDRASYVPRGSTALFDAIDSAISETAKEIATNINAKPIIVVFTDGHENASRKIKDRKELMNKITDLKDKGWQFVFMGADIDAYDEGGAIGIGASSTMSYAKHQTVSAMGTVNNAMNRYRANTLHSSSLMSSKTEFFEKEDYETLADSDPIKSRKKK